MVARLLLRVPGFGRVLRLLAGAPGPAPSREQRIEQEALMLRRLGYGRIAALAAAEALETCREAGLFYDAVELRGNVWYLRAAAEAPGGPLIRVPLPLASQAIQQEIGDRN